MSTYPDCAAIILSGGSSSRMKFPKALLEYRGESFLGRLVRLFGNFCAPVIAVTGAHTPEIRAGVESGGVTWVHNGDWADGQLSSLQCGIRALPSSTQRCFWIPVDYPAIEEQTLAALLDAHEPGLLFSIPCLDGKHGHPILAGRDALDVIAQLPRAASARDVVRNHRHATRFVDVPDSGILLDVDDRAAYHRLLQVNT